MSKISQVEARRLKRRVEQLEFAETERRRVYTRNYPGGVNIAQQAHGSRTEFLPAVIANSRKLGHAVVCTVDEGLVLYYAIPHKDLPA
jgi:hypothetical protein